MLPRRLRLSRRSFPDTRRGRRNSSAHFTIVAVPSPSSAGAVVVSKKIARRSVDRHLLKRRMLMVLRAHLSPTHSLVLYARSGAPLLSFTALKEELSSLLQSTLR